jgi:hypothetical protein
MTFFEFSAGSSFLSEHDPFRKPVSAFRDHALEGQRRIRPADASVGMSAHQMGGSGQRIRPSRLGSAAA